jgi:hypothetical protein
MNMARLLAADASHGDTEDHSRGYRKHRFGNMATVMCQRIILLGKLQSQEGLSRQHFQSFFFVSVLLFIASLYDK